MMRIAEPGHPDCWYGVQDPAQRKKIQNRLAQRARRQRKAGLEGRRCLHQTSSSSHSTRDTPTPFLERGSPFSTLTTVLLPATPVQTNPLFAEIPPSVFAALYDNGTILGVTCGTVLPARSRPPGAHVPESLRPTPLQLALAHSPWIDRFPFPRLRDNLIVLTAMGKDEDGEAFLRDLFSMESFAIRPGGAGWDPRAWSVGEVFRRRWEGLFV